MAPKWPQSATEEASKWDKTVTIVEVRQHDQYVIKIDGSNRTSLRNRKFLRKFLPAKAKPPPRLITEDLVHLPEPPAPTLIDPTPPCASTPPTTTLEPTGQTPSRPSSAPNCPNQGKHRTQSHTVDDPPEASRDPAPMNTPPPRRSRRVSRRPLYLSDYVSATMNKMTLPKHRSLKHRYHSASHCS